MVVSVLIHTNYKFLRRVLKRVKFIVFLNLTDTAFPKPNVLEKSLIIDARATLRVLKTFVQELIVDSDQQPNGEPARGGNVLRRAELEPNFGKWSVSIQTELRAMIVIWKLNQT